MKAILITFVFIFINYSIFSQNLITNSGAELDPTSNGWTQVSGSWVRGNAVSAYEGSYYFYAGTGITDFELYQDIDVSGYASEIDAGLQDFSFSGWIRNFSGSDKGRIIVEYRNSSSTVLASYNTGEQGTTTWTEYTDDSRTAPTNTRTIRIRLISTRYNGADNDGYFDDLDLTTTYTGSNSPGGVSTGNVFWVKANEGIIKSGTNVSTWVDRSGSNNNASQTTSGNQPSYTSVQRNYNPSVYFDGDNDYMGMNDLITSTNTTMSIYAVGTNGTGGDTWGSMVYGQSTAGLSGGYGLSEMNGDGSIGFWATNYNDNFVHTAWPNNSLSIIEGIYNGTNVNLYIDAGPKGSDNYIGAIGENGNTYLGGEADSYNHKGYISEVAIYSSALSTDDRYKLNSYFAIKYGITLDIGGNPNYVASDGTTVFNANSTYWNDIIGIGRDNNSGLNQKQSHTTDDTLKVYLSTLEISNNANSGSFKNDTSYLILGSDNGKMHSTMASFNERPSGIFTRIEREWRVAYYMIADVAKMQFQLGSNDWGDITESDLVVLWDADGDFSLGAEILEPSDIYAYSFNSTSGVLTFTVNFNSLETTSLVIGFITIGSKSEDSPLPIELMKFEGEITSNNLVQLNWQTATETNNDYFTIERSPNTDKWKEISKIDGAGNSNSMLSYTSIDDSPLMGLSYYRLKQTDFDGKYSYSNTISINIGDEAKQLVLYPNPTTGFITIEGIIGDVTDYHIYNITGQDVVNKVNVITKSESQITMDISLLPKGVYILHANSKYIKVLKK